MEFASQPQTSHRRGPWALIIMAVLFILMFVFNLGYQSNWWRPMSGWQAVFLSNGQVYFGNVTSLTPDTVVLEKIYYLQTSGPLQAGGEQQPKDLALVKLGSELHGPADEMMINRDQILFIETLKTDSKVVKAIEQFGSK